MNWARTDRPGCQLCGISPTVFKETATRNHTIKTGRFEHVGAERTTWGLVGPHRPLARTPEGNAQRDGMIISVRVSFTTMAVDAAPWPKTDPAATTDDMSLMAVPAH